MGSSATTPSKGTTLKFSTVTTSSFLQASVTPFTTLSVLITKNAGFSASKREESDVLLSAIPKTTSLSGKWEPGPVSTSTNTPPSNFIESCAKAPNALIPQSVSVTTIICWSLLEPIQIT